MRTGTLIATVLVSMLLVTAAHAATDPASEKLLKSTSDHTKFKALQRDFSSGPEVTKARLPCHTEAAKQKLNTSNRRKST